VGQNGTIFLSPVFFFFLLEELPWSVVELDEDALPALAEDPFSISFTCGGAGGGVLALPSDALEAGLAFPSAVGVVPPCAPGAAFGVSSPIPVSDPGALLAGEAGLAADSGVELAAGAERGIGSLLVASDREVFSTLTVPLPLSGAPSAMRCAS